MYYFLAITLRKDVVKGTFFPSYILCRAWTTSTTRTGLRVVKCFGGEPTSDIPKVLVTDPAKHQDLVNYMSVYQTQDEFRGRHYHPEGALCWYECNAYEEPTGHIIFVRKVPITSLMWNFSLKRKFKQINPDKPERKTIQFLLSHEPGALQNHYTHVKPKLYQPPVSNKTKLKGQKKYGTKNKN